MLREDCTGGIRSCTHSWFRPHTADLEASLLVAEAPSLDAPLPSVCAQTSQGDGHQEHARQVMKFTICLVCVQCLLFFFLIL